MARKPRPIKPNSIPRSQCAKCPWKVTTDPNEIPNGYCSTKHANLKVTIAEPGNVAAIHGDVVRIMACHETAKSPCVGWLDNQLGPGNNLQLRLFVMNGKIDANYRLVGEQHERFEDTLPTERCECGARMRFDDVTHCRDCVDEARGDNE